VRRRALVGLSLPLGASGCLAGHAIGYALVGARAEDAHIHGYLGYAPEFLAICLAVIALSLARRLTGRLPGCPAAWPFALVPPLAFLAQELIERLADGLPAHAVLEAPVYAGLAAQLPVAVIAYLAACALLRVTDAAARALGRLPVVKPRPLPLLFPALVVEHPRASLAFDHMGRAPPGNRA
jgi:hypothetical protein